MLPRGPVADSNAHPPPSHGMKSKIQSDLIIRNVWLSSSIQDQRRHLSAACVCARAWKGYEGQHVIKLGLHLIKAACQNEKVLWFFVFFKVATLRQDS